MSTDTSNAPDQTVTGPPTGDATMSGGSDAGGGGAQDHNDPIVGRQIDGCRVVRKLGQGGMGVVYLAHHESLGQDFVLKILNPALTGAEDTVDRFFREAQACAQLNHPGIVAIQNVGQEQDYYYIRMEYIEGETLEDVVRDDKQVDWRKATRLMLATAEALSHAHQKGMIHRDIKPENIMLTPKGEVKVMDFGLAKHVHSSAKVSVTGQIVGTPFFMSPEQAGGKPTDARSDIYSVGVTLYYMVTGVKPFNGKNLQEIFLKHFFYAPESPKIYNDALPEALCEIVKRCLKKKKKERYQSAKALARDLQSVLDDPSAPLGDRSDAGGAGGPAPDVDVGSVDGDKTMVADGADGGATVRVDSDAGATVRVESAGGGLEGADATMVARGPVVPRKRGEVKSVSFDQATGVLQEDESTLNIGADADEEPAHAGLDLPTTMLDAAGYAVAEKEPVKERPSEEVALASKKRKQKLGIVAGLLLVPLLGSGFVYSTNKKKLEEQKREFDRLLKSPNPTVDEFRSLQGWLQGYVDGHTIAPIGDAQNVLATVQARTALAEQRARDEQRRIREERERSEAQTERQQRLDAVRTKVRAGLAEAEQIKLNALDAMGRGLDTGALWKAYMQRSKALLADYGQYAAEFAELDELLERVTFPVLVTSDPEGADVFLDERTTPEPALSGSPTRVVWVRPGQPFVLRIVKHGFSEERIADTADDIKYPYVELKRKELRPAIDLGTVRVTFGANADLKEEPLTPIHDAVAVTSKGGTAYFVDHTGVMRALDLRKGRLAWTCPSGPGCSVEKEPSRHGHEVGAYGDPTPMLEVIDGRVILASSLLGRLTAHDPSQHGKVIWTTSLGASATSPATFKPVFNVIAVGAASGDVFFLNDAGQAFWKFPTDGVVVSAPYFWGERFCIAGSSDNRLYSTDWRARKVLDHLDLGADITVGPVPIGRQLLVGTARGQVHMIDVTAEGKLRELRVLGTAQDERVTGIEAVADQVFFTAGRTLYAMNERGEPLWDVEGFTGTGELTRPVVSADLPLAYVGSADGKVYAIERSTGSVRWRFNVPGDVPVHQRPLMNEDELFVMAGSKVFVLALE